MAVAGCLFACKAPEQKVMARFVPERADDFVFENNLVAGRFYGEALEGNPTSPGVDIWVKLPGALVANDWYAHAVEDGGYYHHDHGGKDCYKVAVSLGGGASVPFIADSLRFPATNYRSYEILTEEPEKVVFVLHYPAWDAAEGISVALDKKVTVCADTYFVEVEDTYTFSGADSLVVAAGIKLHGAQETIVEKLAAEDRYAIWEKASDQSVEPEDGMLGVAVVMPGADEVVLREDLDHALLLKKVVSGEKVCYSFGSCWSKGDLQTADAWFDVVRKM
jgi:pectinesterase